MIGPASGGDGHDSGLAGARTLGPAAWAEASSAGDGSATALDGEQVGAVVCGLAAATKSFGGTVALRDVSIELRAGDVLALLGENGAGKSTCVKLLAGVYEPDSGACLVDGQPVTMRSPLDAQRHGIAVMHQHPGLFRDLSVTENIFLGHAWKDRWGRLDHARMRRKARELLQAAGLGVEPDEQLSRLRSSEQQLVEVARALSLHARVLIMDEPTAALSQREVEQLFKVVADLRRRGVAMMFVGHRMEEIYRVANRIAVLRDGQLIATEQVAELPPARAVQLMVGRALSAMYPDIAAPRADIVLQVEGVARSGVFGPVSFEVRAGEILGFGGLVGSGRTEIARVLFGVDQPTAGAIRLDGQPVDLSSPREAMRAGIAYVSEDRIGQSLIMDFAILTNASLPVIGRAAPAGLVRRALELALVKPHLERLRLRFRSFDQPAWTLSGGNQQKVALAKWLATEPRLLILDEPTQGIDVQTKAEVHAMIADLARHGLAIVLISSELPELLGMCSRILVLREGRISAEFVAGAATQEQVLLAATDAQLGDASPGAQLPDAGHRQAPVDGHSVAASADAPRRLIPRWAMRRELGLVAAMLVVALPVIAINPRMLSEANLLSLAMDAGLLAIAAAGQMLVLITRNIDLSVASVIGLTAYASADLLHAHPDAGIVAALALACALGLACGLLNGAVVTLGRMPAIVVTLGTLSIFRGLNSLLAGGHQVSADQVPQAWLDLTSAKFAGIPGIVLIAIATLLLLAFVLSSLPAGRELFAIGSNPDGAKLIGIRITRRVLGAFAVAGLLAGFDGALWASRYATIDARVAIGFELTVIAAVVVGGVAVRGGSGTVLGVALGGLTLLVIRNGLTLVRVDPLWLQGAYGLVILAAVVTDTLVARRAVRPGVRRPL